jgi:hypothetical protein
LQRRLEAARRLQEEFDMLTLQPVTQGDGSTDTESAASRRKVVVDQDTSNPDGFIARLSKKGGADKLSKAGILSPEDAADMFTSQGSGMFSQTEEDKELIARYCPYSI